MGDHELLDEFVELFLELANHDGYLSAECQQCNSSIQTDLAPTRYSVQTIKQVMKLFYTTQLQYDTIPWAICDSCCCYFCPGCSFDIISTTIASGMLTAHCPQCSKDFSYSDIMESEVYGEVILFNFSQQDSDSDDDPIDEDEYEDLVNSRPNDIDYECSVCYTIKSRIDSLACNHQFCRDCLFRSLQLYRCCPLCRYKPQ